MSTRYSERGYDDDDFELTNDLMLAIETVPWIRRGCPDIQNDHDRKKSTRWDGHVLNAGLKRDRLLSDEFLLKQKWSNPVMERAFAEMWDYENNKAYYRYGGPYRMFFRELADIGLMNNDHDERIMAYSLQAVIQWLGTNVGGCFLKRTQEYAEKERERLENIIDPERAEREARFKQERKEREIKDIQERKEREMKDMFAKEIKRKVAEEVARQLPKAVEEEIKRREAIAQKTINPIRQITI